MSRFSIAAGGWFRRVERAGVAAVVAAAVSAVAPDASAQNPRDVPLGGRTATMGGAGTAAGNDSAMPYLNPAGMAGVPGDVFAISASVHAYRQRNLGNVVAPSGWGTTFGRTAEEQDSAASAGAFDLPSAVMYFLHLSPADAAIKHAVGVSLVVPVASRFDLVSSGSVRFPDSNGSATRSLTLSRSSTDSYAGPTWAAAFGDRVRVGVSAYAMYRQKTLSFQTATAINSSGVIASSSAASGATLRGLAFVPITGAQVRVVDRLWLGAALAAPGIPLTGRVESTSEVNDMVSDGRTTVFGHLASSLLGKADVQPPARLNVGAAWDDRGGLSFAADAFITFARSNAQVVDARSVHQESQTFDVDRFYTTRDREAERSVQAIGLSAGAEIPLSAQLALRAGGFTDRANTPEFVMDDAAKLLGNARYDRVGAVLGLGLAAGSFDSTFGLQYTRGIGKFVAGDATSDAAMAAGHFLPVLANSTEDTVAFVLSGAVTTEEAKATIRDSAPARELPAGARGLP